MGMLDGKVAIVTGAGRGIGREEALLLASEGAKVIVNDVGASQPSETGEKNPAEEVVELIPDRRLSYVLLSGLPLVDYHADDVLVECVRSLEDNEVTHVVVVENGQVGSVPQTLIELAKRQTLPSRIRTHEGLQRTLECLRQRDVWYALTVRAHKVNGERVDLTTIRWPYRDSRYFPELLDVLALAAGEPPSDPTPGFSNVSISVLPDDWLTREPREVMHAALGADRN